MDVSNSVTAAWISGPVIQIGSVSKNVTLALTRADYTLQWLEPVPLTDETEHVPQHKKAPSYLLDARRGVVPYLPRPDVQEQLSAWLSDDAPMSVLLVHGPGGHGKTRLAAAFATRVHQMGWLVAQAVEFTQQAQPGTPADRPVLVVVDYAERWRATVLQRMIASLPADFRGQRVRVLLLARSSALWRPLSDQLDRLPVELPEPIRLGDLAADREYVFHHAVGVFSTALNRETREIETPDLSSAAYESVLTLHMAALVAVCSDSPEDHPAPGELSQYLLRHERRFWPTEIWDDLACCVFLATLLGPVTTEAACALLDRASVARDALRWHDRLYPPAARTALTPLRPDRFGEDFIADHLLHDPRACDLLTELPLGRNGLITLAAAAERHEHVRNLLWSLLPSTPNDDLSDPLIEVVAQHAPTEVRQAVHDRLPHFRVDLLRSPLLLAQQLHDSLPVDARFERAVMMTDLANRQSIAGDHQAALTSVTAAIEDLRQLSETDAKVQSELARSLQDAGTYLHNVGKWTLAWGPADEAVEIYRKLAAENPAHRFSLAQALTTSALRFSEINNLSQAAILAREAITLWQRIPRFDPLFHDEQLARAYNALGVVLLRDDSATEAVEALTEAAAIYRRLTELDFLTYLPSWARNMANVGVALAFASRHDSALTCALTAVEACRILVSLDEEAFLSMLASACLALASGQNSTPDPAPEALPHAEEALALYRRLETQQPGVFKDNMAAAETILAELRFTPHRP
ncbi:hypothetical protein ACTG9Q_31785 [Actinokineospora sp. 24-640]